VTFVGLLEVGLSFFLRRGKKSTDKHLKLLDLTHGPSKVLLFLRWRTSLADLCSWKTLFHHEWLSLDGKVM